VIEQCTNIVPFGLILLAYKKGVIIMCMKANFLEIENNMAMKVNELKYSKMTIDRLEEALALITDVYHGYNGKEDTEEGKKKFKELIDYDWHKKHLEGEIEFLGQSDAKHERDEEGYICIGTFYIPPDFHMWICEDTGINKVVGVLAMYDEHVYWMFVDGSYHCRGIARSLFDMMLAELKPERLTVSASLYAAEVYRKFGFVDTDVEQIANGIRYIPMEYINECA